MTDLTGRTELLSWINLVGEAKYAAVEDLADCVLYTQLLAELFPSKGGASFVRSLNMNATVAADAERNVAIFQDAIKHLVPARQSIFVDPVRMAAGKLQDHMKVLTWVHQLALKTAGRRFCIERAAEKRRELHGGRKMRSELELERHQGPSSYGFMEAHHFSLGGGAAYDPQQYMAKSEAVNQWDPMMELEAVNSDIRQFNERLRQRRKQQVDLEGNIRELVSVRDTLHQHLTAIEQICLMSERQDEDSLAHQLLQVLSQPDFLVT